jgi:hypothetical protein
VDVAQITGDESSYAYLMFRAAATVFYWYGISNDSFDLFTSTDPVVMLQPWKKSTFVKPDRDTNRLKVICAGKTIELYVNGHKVGTYNDASSLSGQLLLGVSAGSSKSGASYSFDNLKIYKLQ